jgi:hypothetical protein
MHPTLLISILAIIDILGMIMGYEGIARLHEHHLYPFWPDDGVMRTYSMAFPPPPKLIIYAWDSWLGWLLLTVGCVLAPVAAASAMLRNQKYLTGLSGMILWMLMSGAVGVWIYGHAVFNAGFN